MICPRYSRVATLSRLLLAFAMATLLFQGPPIARAQDPAKIADSNPGQFFTITEPITGETLEQIKASTRHLLNQNSGAAPGKSPILVFEFRAGDTQPGASTFGNSYDLAWFIMKSLGGAKLTVAYVPEPISGYATLAALACDEIVMGPKGSLGPISPENENRARDIRENIRNLAISKQREPDLLLGMLDREADLRKVTTDDKQVHYLLAESLPEFQKSHSIIQDQPAWEGGQRGVMTADRAREEGFSKLTADSRAEIASTYKLAGRSMADNPTLGQELRPVWVQIKGPLDTVKRSYLTRRIEQARQEKVNLIFFQIDSQGGDIAADAIAETIANIKDMKTVAFIDDRAIGMASLVALACNDIVFRKGGECGDLRQFVTGRNGQVVDLGEARSKALVERAENIAERKGHSIAVARAMVDPEAVVFQATDSKTGNVAFVLKTQLEAEPGRYVNPVQKKSPGEVLTLKADNDEGVYGLGQIVNDTEEFKGLYGLRGKAVRIDGPTWVDALVTILTDPFVSWILLFVGLFMLVVELKLPGIGLPGITSALAFLLFFWSHYLSGTADQLEIILFLVGMICMALELFVFPGFGVFGMSGILLILTSIVMASHTFVWPTQEYEYRELGYTLLQLTFAMVAVSAGAVVLARYFPSMPLFNRLVLKPEPWTGAGEDDPTVKSSLEGYDTFAYLIGETGRTTSVLRPSGKARFGDALIDVTADGFFIEPDSLVEVVDVQGSRVIVKRLGA
ncbi:NfeD family protein [Singulisphaera sp. PoT]|uniref:NfeD family protein n=1 Tax=Singulisphaera sp. PoT TaxID=3411797 RepID=UPI003BF4834B